ncbi:MAG: glycosyltransferase [Candidatus Acidiferrales bacterium]
MGISVSPSTSSRTAGGPQSEMRVLMVTQAFSPFFESGGPAAKVTAIAVRLSARGHAVTVLTADLGLEKHEILTEFCPWGRKAVQSGVETIFLRTRTRYRWLTLNPSAAGFCQDSVASFQVVHIFGLYDFLGPVAAHFSFRKHIPYIVEPMGMFRPIVRNILIKRMYHGLLGRKLIKHAARLIATSMQEREELFEGGVPEHNIVVRRNGIELPQSLPERGIFRRKLRISEETKLILFLGRLVSKKSPDMLLQAYAHWRSRKTKGVPSSILVLAGPSEDEGYFTRLQRMSRRLGIESQVLFPGALYGEEKWAAYQDADVFVLPSQNENFGNTVAEAMAAGTPVIVTDRCGIASLVGERAGVVIPYQLEALKNALHRLLDSSELLEQCRGGCTETARNLSWDKPIAELETLYTSVVPGAAT